MMHDTIQPTRDPSEVDTSLLKNLANDVQLRRMKYSPFELWMVFPVQEILSYYFLKLCLLFYPAFVAKSISLVIEPPASRWLNRSNTELADRIWLKAVAKSWSSSAVLEQSSFNQLWGGGVSEDWSGFCHKWAVVLRILIPLCVLFSHTSIIVL